MARGKAAPGRMDSPQPRETEIAHLIKLWRQSGRDPLKFAKTLLEIKKREEAERRIEAVLRGAET